MRGWVRIARLRAWRAWASGCRCWSSGLPPVRQTLSGATAAVGLSVSGLHYGELIADRGQVAVVGPVARRQGVDHILSAS
jgi:hypothetical protein